MQKRIADFLEKMSVGFLVGAYFQESFWAIAWSFIALAYCLHLTRRLGR